MLTQSDPLLLIWSSLTIRQNLMANCGRMARGQWSQRRAYRKTTIALSNGTINDTLQSPRPPSWVHNASLVMCRISNGHISATGDPIHFMFGSRVDFQNRRIKWRYFRFDQTQDGRNDTTWHDTTDDIDKSQATSPYAELFWPLSLIRAHFLAKIGWKKVHATVNETWDLRKPEVVTVHEQWRLLISPWS